MYSGAATHFGMLHPEGGGTIPFRNVASYLAAGIPQHTNFSCFSNTSNIHFAMCYHVLVDLIE